MLPLLALKMEGTGQSRKPVEAGGWLRAERGCGGEGGIFP